MLRRRLRPLLRPRHRPIPRRRPRPLLRLWHRLMLRRHPRRRLRRARRSSRKHQPRLRRGLSGWKRAFRDRRPPSGNSCRGVSPVAQQGRNRHRRPRRLRGPSKRLRQLPLQPRLRSLCLRRRCCLGASNPLLALRGAQPRPWVVRLHAPGRRAVQPRPLLRAVRPLLRPGRPPRHPALRPIPRRAERPANRRQAAPADKPAA